MPGVLNKTNDAALHGRPREFYLNEALDRAMLVFWRKGYEGASLSDLTEALGVARPSLYAAFGNKEQLFRKALDRYDEGTPLLMGFDAGAQGARGHRGLAARGGHLHGHPTNPPGCLMVHGALVGSDASDPLRRETRDRRDRLREAIRARWSARERKAICRPTRIRPLSRATSSR